MKPAPRAAKLDRKLILGGYNGRRYRRAAGKERKDKHENIPGNRPAVRGHSMITVEHLTKYYGSFLAVDNISFEINEGHVYGFLGPNGAGKSTTMNIMTG